MYRKEYGEYANLCSGLKGLIFSLTFLFCFVFLLVCFLSFSDVFLEEIMDDVRVSVHHCQHLYFLVLNHYFFLSISFTP